MTNLMQLARDRELIELGQLVETEPEILFIMESMTVYDLADYRESMAILDDVALSPVSLEVQHAARLLRVAVDSFVVSVARENLIRQTEKLGS